ncbi:RHS repeat-associated core domain-containing protein [Actinokineospora sp. 24-640]
MKTLTPWSYAPLVSDLDAHGHELKYVYEVYGRTSQAPAAGQPREFALSRVDYVSPGQTNAYAQVVFARSEPSVCVPNDLPVGARLDYQFGFGRLSGTRKVTTITTRTRDASDNWVDSRRYALRYSSSDSCASGSVTPFRELLGVTQTVYSPSFAVGDPARSKILPETTFTYGKAGSYVRDSDYGPTVAAPQMDMQRSIYTRTGSPNNHNGEYNFSDSAEFRMCDDKFCAVPGSGGMGSLPGRPGMHVSWLLSQAQASGESVSRMWLDVNRDGLVDMLKTPEVDLATRTNVPTTGGCKVEVYVNKGPDGFVKDPTVFGDFSLTKAMADVPVPQAVDATGRGELVCSLSRSLSATSSGWFGDTSRPCHAENDPAFNWGAPESWGSMQQVRHGFFDATGDGKPDLVSQAIASVHCPYASESGYPAPRAEGDPAADEYWENEYRSTAPSGPAMLVTKRQNRWHVYENTGTGFSETARTMVVPKVTHTDGKIRRPHLPQTTVQGPFTSSTGEENVGSVVDFNGDGFRDWAANDFTNVVSGKVFSGDGNGFSPPVVIPDGASGLFNSWTPWFHTDPWPAAENYEAFTEKQVGPDINGDGLPDRVVKAGAGATGSWVKFNNGVGFGDLEDDGQTKFSDGTMETSALRWFREETTRRSFQNYRELSDMFFKTSMVDVDYDGLPDAVHYDDDSTETATGTFLSSGRQWTRRVDTDVSVARSLNGWVRLDGMADSYADRGDYKYGSKYDSVDVDGDGLRDLLERNDATGGVKVRYAKRHLDESPDHAAPARLLRTVSNGYGAKTTVSYQRDTAAGAWTVSQLSVDPGQGEPVITSKFKNKFPVFTANPYGRHKFRGYEETVTLQVGDPGRAEDDLSTVQLHSFAQDYQGVMVKSVTALGSGAFDSDLRFTDSTPNVMAVSVQDYQRQDLGRLAPGMSTGFAPRVVLPTTTTSYACTGKTGQTAQQCQTSAPSTTSQAAWTTVAGHSPLMLVSSTESRFVNGEGKQETHRTEHTHKISVSATRFVIAPDTSTDKSGMDGSLSQKGQTRYAYYDGSDYLQVKNITVDAADPTVADRVTRYQYYGGTGTNRSLLYRTWAPEQIAKYGNTNDAKGFSEVAYDRFGVHVTKTTIEHKPAPKAITFTTETKTDLGTGAVLRTTGPDYVCADGTDADTAPDPPTACTFAQAIHHERVDTKVDGLGRPLSVTRFPASNSPGVEIVRATHNDANPASTITESLVGDGEFSWEKAETDGLGRTVKSTIKQSPNPDVVTMVDYDHVGRVAVSWAPRADGLTGHVGTRTTYDPLGRPISVAETGTLETRDDDRVFARNEYDGLTHTAIQETLDGSQAKRTRATTDVAGRILTVDEQSGGTTENPVWASTRYAYDITANKTTVTDPDGAKTEMRDDYFGQRRSSTTSGRTWAFGYDANGNLTTVIEPVKTGHTAEDYTHTRVYDDLDRLVQEIPAKRDLSAEDKTEFFVGNTTYFYDGAHPGLGGGDKANHQLGRLAATTSGQIDTGTASTTYHRYDPFGNMTESHQLLGALDHVLPNLGKVDRLQIDITADAAGNIEKTEHRAFLPGQGSTLVTYDGPQLDHAYDTAGTPDRVSLRVGGKDMTIATARNAAGALIRRGTNADGTTGFARPSITYTNDRFGRVTDVTARHGSTDQSIQRYRQTYTYADNGLINNSTEQLGDILQPTTTTTYQYDTRHQLLDATRRLPHPTDANQPGELTYHGAFTYTPGGRVKTADVVASTPSGENPAAGARVPTRNVTHTYQPPATLANPTSDPQRLDKLTKPDGTDYTSYKYDDAGNTTKRTLSDGTVIDQVWDGDRLRKITTPSGTETYFYDGATRVAAIHRNTDGTVNQTRRWFGGLEITQQSGQTAKHHTTITLAGDTIARLDGDELTGTIEHTLTTPQGHHALSLDATTGATTKRVVAYGPYGEILSEHTAQNPDTLEKYTQEFNGKIHDAVSGLHYYGHRYYDPTALQWASTDPLYHNTPDRDPTSPRNANLYTYTNNNPINYIDRDGLDNQMLVDNVVTPVNVGSLYFGSEKWWKDTLSHLALAYLEPDWKDVHAFIKTDSTEERAWIAAGFLGGGMVDALAGLRRASGVGGTGGGSTSAPPSGNRGNPTTSTYASGHGGGSVSSGGSGGSHGMGRTVGKPWKSTISDRPDPNTGRSRADELEDQGEDIGNAVRNLKHHVRVNELANLVNNTYKRVEVPGAPGPRLVPLSGAERAHIAATAMGRAFGSGGKSNGTSGVFEVASDTLVVVREGFTARSGGKSDIIVFGPDGRGLPMTANVTFEGGGRSLVLSDVEWSPW